ncbi:MAG: ATP-binding protein, partial [Candidatus Odinarchaeia archaeon]
MGGLQPSRIYHVYGPSSSGKTTFALQILKEELDRGYKVIWVDTERKSFINRLLKMGEHNKIVAKIKNIIVFTPKTFKEQGLLVNKLPNFISPKIRLVVFDTITNLYRSELWEKENNIQLNKELNR